MNKLMRFHFQSRQMRIGALRLRGVAALLAALLAAFSVAPAAFAEDCDPNQLNQIKGQVTLPPNCTYHRQIRITEGNTTLDCRGSTFIGNERQQIGLMIDSGGQPMSDITVKNCNFNDFSSSGVRVTWSEEDASKGSTHEEIYRRTPTRILLENVSVHNNGRVGIYLDDYTSDVTIKNSKITGSGGVGIYLEHSSRNIKLLGNRISGNGFGKSPREGLAVDSSARNIIEGNVFQGNAAGGIFLYKNCGEHISSGKQVIRWQHSDDNLIKQNFFVDEKVGIWLASRQGKKLAGSDCGDPVDARGGHADFADFNHVEGNSFCRTAVAVTDDGKRNEIRGSKNSCPSDLINKN